MDYKVIAHDTKTAIATVEMSHNGVQLEHQIDLKMVIPGSMRVLEEMGIEFNKTHQLKALARYVETITLQIDQGVITNPPESDTTE